MKARANARGGRRRANAMGDVCATRTAARAAVDRAGVVGKGWISEMTMDDDVALDRGDDARAPLLNVADGDMKAAEADAGEGGVDWKLILIIAIPTMFDLIATTLAGIGLLWTSVSVYQMLRGALPVKILRRTFVDWKARRCTDSHWPGFFIPPAYWLCISMTGCCSGRCSRSSSSKKS